MAAASAGRTWGATAEERARPYPCDRYLPDAHDAYHRAIDVDAPRAVVFRWLCQLRAAPYSYDLIDNFGRRSPRRLTPGLGELATGQRVMTIFRLAEFEPGEHLTLVLDRAPWLLGEVAVTYAVSERPGGSRIVVKVAFRYPGGRAGAAAGSRAMPWLDLLMMRRQLLNLKQLAERDARTAPGA